MSGPKAFRIVTREQVVAICEGHLARLDAAIAEWIREGERHHSVSATDLAAVSKRRDELRRLLTENRFTELQKQVPAEISFLHADTQKRLEKAAVAKAEARHALRRSTRTAAMLLDTLDKAGRDVPADLRRALKAGDVSQADLTSAINSAFRLLSTTTSAPRATDRQRTIAERLGEGEHRATLEEWLSRQPPETGDAEVLRIDRHLAELFTLGVDVSPFERRTSVIVGEADQARRALLSDSLLADLAVALKSGRERRATLGRLRDVRVDLARMQRAGVPALLAKVDAALERGQGSGISGLIEEADTLIAEETRVMAAEARRRAVLSSLASLGYEVNDGMETAWVQGGRIVLRKAAARDYGVELGGGVRSDQMQVRAVAFGNSRTARNSQRDRDMETIWCGEFGRLQAMIGASGGGIEIERALPVGAVPLKLIEDGSNTATIEDEVPDARTLDR